MEGIRNRLRNCQRGISEVELLNYQVWATFKDVQVKCPNILATGFATESEFHPNFFMSRVECGQLYEGYNLTLMEAKAREAKLLCDEQVAAATAGYKSVIASGIHTIPSTATTQTISVPGLLATDTVHVTLHTRAGTEAVVTAVPTANTLTIVFSAAPAVTTKVNWSAIR